MKDTGLEKAAVLFRTMQSFFILLRNVGLRSALIVLFSSRTTSAIQRIWICTMNRYFEFRGNVDRKTLHVLYSNNYMVESTEQKPIRYIIDGGANIGDQTLRFRHFNKDAEIVAIEPDRGNFAILERNFGHDPKTHLMNAAIWNENGLVRLSKGGDAVSHKVSSETGDIPAVTIPLVMKQYGFPYIDILKLDVEGAEIEIFKDASQWADLVNVVIVEPHDRMRDGCGFAIVAPFLSLNFNLFVCGENLVLVKRGLGWSVKNVLYY